MKKFLDKKMMHTIHKIWLNTKSMQGINVHSIFFPYKYESW